MLWKCVIRIPTHPGAPFLRSYHHRYRPVELGYPCLAGSCLIIHLSLRCRYESSPKLSMMCFHRRLTKIPAASNPMVGSVELKLNFVWTLGIYENRYRSTPVMATHTLSSMLPNLYTGIGWRLSLLLAPHELYLSFYRGSYDMFVADTAARMSRVEPN